jgi:hypothetical protein
VEEEADGVGVVGAGKEDGGDGGVRVRGGWVHVAWAGEGGCEWAVEAGVRVAWAGDGGCAWASDG